jgi:hypothetical protein
LAAKMKWGLLGLKNGHTNLPYQHIVHSYTPEIVWSLNGGGLSIEVEMHGIATVQDQVVFE